MKNIYKALASFQQEVPVILKDTSGYNYKYADLPAIIEVINPLLKKNGLGFYQSINGTKIKTVIFHIESGEIIESETDMPFDSLIYEETIDKKKFVLRGFEQMNKAQAIGSIITYFRRYSLSSILGLVTDKDTDGTGTQEPKIILKPEEALAKAKKDLSEASSLEDLMAIEKGIKKSKNFTDDQKEELAFMANEKREEFDPTN